MNQPPISKSIKPIGRGPGSLIAGATYPARALWLLVNTPRLRHYVLLPILVNILLGITVYTGLLFLGLGAIDAFLANFPTWTAEVSHEVSDVAVRLPQTIHFPDWHLGWPHWLSALPDWHLSWPSWNISLPNWSIQLPDWLTHWNIRLPDWVSNLPNWGFATFIWLLRLVLVVILFLVTGFVFLQFGVLLGSPWYGKLSEEIEKLKTGHLLVVEVNPVVEIWRAIAYELKKLVLVIGIGLPLFLFNFFPGIGTLIATIGGITLTSTITCMDFLDAAVERRRPGFRQKLGIVFHSLPASASFGLVCLGLSSIPLVNLLAIPVCVTAGTLFFCDRVLPEFKDGRN